MVMEVLSEGVLQPKLMDEEVEKATNKNTIIILSKKQFVLIGANFLAIFFFNFATNHQLCYSGTSI